MSLHDVPLPDGWTWEPLAKHYRVTKKPRELSYSGFPTIPFVPMDAVPTGGRERMRVELQAPSAIASGTYFEKGDILLSKITPSFENGKQALAQDLPAPFGIASTEIIPLQASSEEGDNRFLFFYLLHPDVRAALVCKMEGSTGRQRVPEVAVREFLVPTPPKPEQKKIGAVLWKVQRAIELEDKLIATARELKRSAMRQLFTRGLRGEPQRESDIGPLPESWTVQPLEALREFLQYGTSAKCDYAQVGNPVLRIPNVSDGRVDCSDLKWCDLNEREVASWALELGDVLFIRTNGMRDRVGTCAVYQGQPEQALFASYLIRARLRTGVLNPQFFQYYTATSVGVSFLGGRASPAADGKFNVNTKTLDSLLIPVPTIDEQCEITHVLETIDEKIAVHERKCATLRDLFRTLLHELMTGRIRVAALDIDVSEVTAT